MSSARHAATADAHTVEDTSEQAPQQGPPLDDPVARAEWLETLLTETFDMDEEDARMICGIVLEQFGDKKEILDDEIPTTVRSVFYTLEAKRILTFRRIEYESEDGMTLRGFFWRFHPKAGLRPDQEPEKEMDDLSVYEKLPSDCWERPAAS